jgi:MYXO-CTERM domain-containing protein
MVWPIAVDDQPAALKILEFGTKGQAKVVEDRTAKITEMLEKGIKSVSSSGGTGGKASQPTAGNSGSMQMSGSGSGGTGTPGDGPDKAASNDGCSVGKGQPANALSLLLLSFAALFSRRRRSA